jgi:putative endonuclease
MKQYFVYIMASQRKGTIYVGVTSNLLLRVAQHKAGTFAGFTAAHNVDKLVHYEEFNDVRFALEREKKLKKWRRDWKMELIETRNPNWDDLSENSLLQL